MSKEYDQYWKQREQLQNEVQSTVFKPMSFEVFEKSPEEKESLKTMKKDWKESQSK